MKKLKVLVAALSLSAAGFVGIASKEGYTDGAVIPVKGDVPTYGYGSTKRIDGSPVKMGDKTNPVNALQIKMAHINREEKIFRDSLPGVYMHQAEYDMWMDFVYQFGTGNWNKSGMRKQLLDGNHEGACNYLLEYRFVKGYDCSTPGNKICMGVWTRQQERHTKCMSVIGD